MILFESKEEYEKDREEIEKELWDLRNNIEKFFIQNTSEFNEIKKEIVNLPSEINKLFMNIHKDNEYIIGFLGDINKRIDKIYKHNKQLKDLENIEEEIKKEIDFLKGKLENPWNVNNIINLFKNLELEKDSYIKNYINNIKIKEENIIKNSREIEELFVRLDNLFKKIMNILKRNHAKEEIIDTFNKKVDKINRTFEKYSVINHKLENSILPFIRSL